MCVTPIPPTERARGHGGVAIIWKDIHDNIVQPLEDGGVRINVIEIKTPEPLIIGCVRSSPIAG